MNVREELVTGYDDFGNLIFLPAAASVCGAQMLAELIACPSCGRLMDEDGCHGGSAANRQPDAIAFDSAEEA